MKVAIWGSYAYGNYGDELMALLFALYLKRLGAHPIVFCLNESLAQSYGVGTTESADELIRGSAFCVFGGGSLLSANKEGPDWYSQQKEREYEHFRVALEKHKCPLYLLSIGGDGAFDTGVDIAPYRQRLLETGLCKFATVRQEDDVRTLQEKYSIEARYYPDVLLSIADFWDVGEDRDDNGRVNVGLNLPRSYRRSIAALHLLKDFKRDTAFHFIRTVRSQPGTERLNSELTPRKLTSNFREHGYEDPAPTLKFLSTLDVIVTSKLHIGLTALALGTPYICVGKSLKCKAFLHSIGADFAYWGDLAPRDQRIRVLRTLMSQRRIDELRQRYESVSLEEQKRLSRGHLDLLRSVYESYN